MYNAAFVDHTKRESRDQTAAMLSPISRHIHMVAGKITTPAKASATIGGLQSANQTIDVHSHQASISNDQKR
jgi:hypothetical protein